MKRLFADKRNLIILLLCILFIIEIPRQDIRFLFWALAGIITAASCDVAIERFFLHRRIFPKSAVISGFIVGGILGYRQPWFILVIFCLLAIVSKHVIRFKKRHIFNPANFGLFAASLFGIPLTWSIESNIYIIITAGIYIAYSIKKLPHVLGFLIFFSGLSAVHAINPFAIISWFFVFVMLIEPKTSGSGRLRGFIFGSIAGTASFFIFKFFPQYDFFAGSLFIANLFNSLLGKIQSRKKTIRSPVVQG